MHVKIGLQTLSSSLTRYFVENSPGTCLFCSTDEVLFVSNKNTQLYILCLKPQQCQSLRKKRWQKKRKVSLNKLLWRMRVTWTSRKSSPKSMMCRQSLCITKMLNSAHNFGWKRYNVQNKVSVFMFTLEKLISKPQAAVSSGSVPFQSCSYCHAVSGFVHQSSRHFQSMLYERQKLPAWQERETILDLLKSHQVLVVSGMTG